MSHQHHHITRRNLLRLGSIGALGLSFDSLFAKAGEPVEPHFFLQLFFFAGMDASYAFDARPLAMTAAQLQQNYIGTEPNLWTGNNGTSCFATSLVDVLKPFRDDFSILNGVHMATDFDGHNNSIDMYLTGNPSGGEFFVPHLNEGTDAKPLDFLSSGPQISYGLTNAGSGVPLSRESAKSLSEKLQALPPMTSDDPATAFVLSRLDANAVGAGSFALGAQSLRVAMERAPQLADVIKNLDVGADGGSPMVSFLKLITTCFSKGMTRSAVFSPNLSFDTHDFRSASEQPKTIGEAMGLVAETLKFLKETPYDSKRSFLDVTTVVTGTDFSRTMRQDYMKFEETGSDHNPLTNTMLIAGKGIRGGCVLGATDFQTADEVLSGAHLRLDPESVKLMGRPFDFDTQKPRLDLPALYQRKNYLTCDNVVNTIYSAFGAQMKHFRMLERNVPARVLSEILKS